MTPAEYNRQLPSPGNYAKSWQTLLSLDPNTEIRVPGWIVGMPGWGDQVERVGVVLRKVRDAANSRINARAGFVPREPRGGEWPLRRDARAVYDCIVNRHRVYQFETKAARSRFSHLLASRDD